MYARHWKLLARTASTTGGVADLLFDLTRDKATTLVLVTHDSELASRATRVVHMRDGRIE